MPRAPRPHNPAPARSTVGAPGTRHAGCTWPGGTVMAGVMASSQYRISIATGPDALRSRQSLHDYGHHLLESRGAGSARLSRSHRPGIHRGPRQADPLLSRSEEHTSELQSPCNLVCRLLLEKQHKTPWSSSRWGRFCAGIPTLNDTGSIHGTIWVPTHYQSPRFFFINRKPPETSFIALNCTLPF